jgi:hypothetical protein
MSHLIYKVTIENAFENVYGGGGTGGSERGGGKGGERGGGTYHVFAHHRLDLFGCEATLER